MIAQVSGKFENIRALHLHIDNNLEYIMGIPDHFMENIRDLALEDSSLTIDPTDFMLTASTMIQKTNRLVNL